ncbi:MAG: GNAT family N-acetyltransferase [Pseudomonadota bacterium]
MSVHLRPAQVMDAGRVGDLLTQFAASTQWMPKLHSAAEDLAHAEMLITRGWVTVAEAETGVVGFLARDQAEVHALYVAADQQGQGIGAMLLQDAQQARQDLGLWTFQANTGAQRFYLRHGFAEDHRTDGARNDEQLPDIRYVWRRKGTGA